VLNAYKGEQYDINKRYFQKRLVDIFEHSGKEAGLWKLSELTDQTIQDIWRYLKENTPNVYEKYLRPGGASIVSRSLATQKEKLSSPQRYLRNFVKKLK